MNTLKFLLANLIFISLLAFSGCKCRNDDCPGSTPFGFQVVNGDGASLIEATPFRSTYKSDSIQVVGENKKGRWEEIPLSRDAAVIDFSIRHDIQIYVVKYSFASSDTLLFHMTKRSDDCCGPVVTDYTVEVNGMLYSSSPDKIDYVFTKQ